MIEALSWQLRSPRTPRRSRPRRGRRRPWWCAAWRTSLLDGGRLSHSRV